MESYIDQNNLVDRYDYVGSTIGTASVNQKNRTMLIVVQLAFEKVLIKAQAEVYIHLSQQIPKLIRV